MNAFFPWLTQLLEVLAAIAIAPLFVGWIGQWRAWLQNKSAPSIWLPYRGIHKLFHKEAVLANRASPLFRFAPYVVFGSMALLADGLHMASHAGALAITAVGYAYARRHAADPRFSFGTGKVNSLAGFAGALLLAVFAAIMAWESLGRLLDPVAIAFDQAIPVAILGLLVNGASVALLGIEHDALVEPPPGCPGGDVQSLDPGAEVGASGDQ